MNNEFPTQQKYGAYLTRQLIATDGQSVIYRAMHAITGQDVTLRLIMIQSKDVEASLRECFQILQETKFITARNISHVLDYGNQENILYIATDYWPGGSLLKRMERRHFGQNATEPPQLPASQEVLQMVDQVAEALDALHEQGIIHAQLSASSILFDAMGNAAVGDVGMLLLLKALFNLETTNSFNITRYSAPELWEGHRPTAATDLYAFACIIYELLTGRPPFDNNSISKLMKAHTDELAQPPHYLRKELPSDLAMVFWQALAKPVDRRYASARKLYLDLADALQKIPEEPTDFFTFSLDS
ncbi:MAG: serine/threonine protein kinase [Anaerolineae bacterium]|nr:serine/threonine protein kinase [Anaerolineae bacterium]